MYQNYEFILDESISQWAVNKANLLIASSKIGHIYLSYDCRVHFMPKYKAWFRTSPFLFMAKCLLEVSPFINITQKFPLDNYKTILKHSASR